MTFFCGAFDCNLSSAHTNAMRRFFFLPISRPLLARPSFLRHDDRFVFTHPTAISYLPLFSYIRLDVGFFSALLTAILHPFDGHFLLAIVLAIRLDVGFFSALSTALLSHS